MSTDHDTHMEKIIPLYCLVQGESKKNVFKVRIGEKGDVSDLRERIKEKKQNDFANVDPDKLRLWAVSIPIDSNTDAALDGLVLKDNGKDIRELDPSEDIFAVFFEDFGEKIINVIVQPPAPAQATPSNKRRNEYLISPFGEGRDGLCFISDERLALFDGSMTENPVCLLRSPPRSGKTTLAAILEEHFQNKGRRVVLISMLDIEIYHGEKDPDSFDYYWTERAGMSWTQCVNCKEPTDVIIDEAQILYKFVTFFWVKIKLLMQPRTCNPNLRVLLLSMYGDSGVGTANGPVATPIDFDFALGLDDLRLLQNEYGMLVNNFIDLSITDGLTITIPNTVRDAIFNVTLGHPGIIRRILSLFRYEFRRGFRDIPAMLRFLVSPGFRDAIQESRALSWIKKRQFSQDESRILRKALYEMDPQSTFPVDTNNETVMQIVRDFKHSGLVTQTQNVVGGRLQFAAPLVRIMLGQRLFTAPASLSELPKADDFMEFLTLSISRMRPSALKMSLSKSSTETRLFERAWQMEWYRAASTAVPPQASISPDVGPIFGSTGFLDFYVNTGLEWGVELLREGDRMAEHAKRFVNGGEYEDIPLRHWAIVDFRHKSKMLRETISNFWHVLYDDDYSKVIIKRQGHDDVQLTLEGLDVTLKEADLNEADVLNDVDQA